MEQYLESLRRCALFYGIHDEELLSMLRCLEASAHSYGKNQYILQSGQPVTAIGVLVSGSAYIIQEDFWGNRNILAQVSSGQMFAETFAWVPNSVCGVDVIADSPATVLFLDIQQVLTTCSSTCIFHQRAVRNLLSDLAMKNLRFHEKLTHLSQRSTRDKLLSYLSAESIRQGSSRFEIPYNRQQLADYLSVDRSAMSSELGRLRDEGILTFSRNRFTLLMEQ